MPVFLVQADPGAASPRKNDADSMIVLAADASTAKKMAQSRLGADGNAVWNAATVTQIDTAPANWLGWTFRVAIYNPTTGAVVADVTSTAVDTIDNIGAALATALNNFAGGVPNAAVYTGATNVLTIAAVADNIGDHRVVVEIKPPGNANDEPVNVTDLFSALTHLGVAGAALSVTLPADALAVPVVQFVSKRAL